MTMGASEIVVSLLNFCIAILNTHVVEVPRGKGVFETVSAILALVRVSSLVLRPPVNL